MEQQKHSENLVSALSEQRPEQKHTPGPWHVRAEDDGRFCVIDQRSHDRQEVVANARLIAAAPDLLAACVEFVRKVENREAVSTRSYQQMCAAIARATGSES